MVTVMRQKSFHKPNGKREVNIKAKGCHGQQLIIIPGIKPYKAKGKGKTKSMKQIYAEMPRYTPNTARLKYMRKLRRKLATVKMPMPEGRSPNMNPKKNRAARRPRRIAWPSEQK
jgi:hypothetical protein